MVSGLAGTRALITALDAGAGMQRNPDIDSLTDRATVRSWLAVRRATGLLVRAQAANGGWPDAQHIELPLVDAEIIVGLMLARTQAGEDGLVPESPLVATLPTAAVAASHAQPRD